MSRSSFVLRFVSVLICSATPLALARGQHVRIVVDCQAPRLDGAERETCASPDLARSSAAVDSATRVLETRLTGRDREALLDTEGRLRIQRNACQNAGAAVHACIADLLSARLRALSLTPASRDAILQELGRYAFVDLPYLERWADSLVGHHVQLWGCMILAPGARPADRTRGSVGERCSGDRGRRVPVTFTTMTPERAEFFYATPRLGYWKGTVARQGGGLALVGLDP